MTITVCRRGEERAAACRKVESGRMAAQRGSPDVLDRRINVAPMKGRTDRHCRYFLRGFSARMLLYTEMIAAVPGVR